MDRVAGPTSGGRKAWAIWLALGLVLAAAALAYSPVHDDLFLFWDDATYVALNPWVNQGLDLGSAGWAFTSLAASNWHPLTWLSHMADVSLFGLAAGPMKLVNLGLHLSSTLLVFLCFWVMTRSRWPAWLVAAIFALHPLHVESVAWVAERKDVLSGFFWWACVLAYAWRPRTTVSWPYFAALAAFALGLMAKPMLVSLPFVLLLLDYWPLNRFAPGSRRRGDLFRAARPLVLEKLPFFALSLGSMAITLAAQARGGSVGGLAEFPLAVRLAGAIHAYALYALKALWPHPLAALYPHPGGYAPWQIAWAGGLVLFFSWLFLFWAPRKGMRFAPVGWLWFLGALVPVIGLVQVGQQALADRYAYLPLTGLAIILAYGLEGLARIRPGWRRSLAAGVTAWLVVLAGLTFSQARLWQDQETLFTHALAHTKNNYVAHNNLAVVLTHQGRVKEAESHYREAVRIRPDYALALYNLGKLAQARDAARQAEAFYRRATEAAPRYTMAHNNLANVLLAQGRLEEALAHYREAVEIEPDHAMFRLNLGLALLRLDRPAEAGREFRRALELKPDLAPAKRLLEKARERASGP